MFARYGAGKPQRAFTQDALIRVGAQERFHQHRVPRLLRFLTGRHIQRVVDLRQQRAAFAVGQETVVTHHFKVSGRDVADVTPQHLLLAQFLAFVLLRVVVVIPVNDRAATVMTELRRRHRRAFQIAAQVFYAAPGTAGLFGEVNLPVALILRLQVALPLLLIAKVAMAGQRRWVNAVIAGAQQTDDGAAPDFFDLLFFEEQVAPDGVLGIETTAGDGDVDVRMLVELAAVGVQGTEDADLSMPSLRASLSMARVAQRNRSLSSGQLLLKNGHSRCGMVKVICCQSQSGRMCCCSAIHCSVPLRPQLLQALDLQVWQIRRECEQLSALQQYFLTPMAQVPQASMRSTESLVQSVS